MSFNYLIILYFYILLFITLYFYDLIILIQNFSYIIMIS